MHIYRFTDEADGSNDGENYIEQLQSSTLKKINMTNTNNELINYYLRKCYNYIVCSYQIREMPLNWDSHLFYKIEQVYDG